MNVFDGEARARFAARYPEVPHGLSHGLEGHPLLEYEALARLAERLPATSIECNVSDQPIGVDAVPEQTRHGIGDIIRESATSGHWVGLRNVEQDTAYGALLEDLLAGLRPEIEERTGPLLNLQSFVFISSPGSVTPYHFDPEHNVLLQIRGTKVMSVFTAGDPRFAADELHEAYHAGARPELPWRDEMAAGAQEFPLGPGDAVYVPVMAPHFVRSGPEPSVSISITWRSEWSYAEADARAFNGRLRKLGMSPRSPGRWPDRNLAKAVGWRLMRRLG